MQNFIIKIRRYSHVFFNSQQASQAKLSFCLFALLLSLSPYIFNLSLYNHPFEEEIPAEYSIDPLRFESLSYEMLEAGDINKPQEPRIELSKEQRKAITAQNKRGPEEICLLIKPSRATASFQDMFLQAINEALKCDEYKRQLRLYKQALKTYNKKLSEVDKSELSIIAQADTFISSAHEKPSVCREDNYCFIAASKYSSGHFNEFITKLKLPDDGQTTRSESSDEDVQQVSALPIILSLTSMLAVLLCIPAFIIALRQRLWALALLGLSIPAFNSALLIVSLITQQSGLGLYHLATPLIAQLGFFIFLLHGHLRSRIYAIFIVLLLISVLVPAVVSMFQAGSAGYSNFENYSIFRALLPIIIFVLVCIIVRLLIVGARENLRLLRGLGFKTCFGAAFHALLLWLPLGLLCLPFFYVSHHLIPKTLTNTLHESKILVRDYSYEGTQLNNALVSVAHIADDANFGWHLVVEERKALLYAKNDDLQNTNFQATVDKHFDNIIPSSLDMPPSESGAPFVGFIVDLANDSMKKTIQQSYKSLRGDINRALLDAVETHETRVKELAEDNVTAAVVELESMRLSGAEALDQINTNTQAMVFSSFTMLFVYQSIALLLFLYICTRSYFYVFARVCFNQNRGGLMTLGDSSQSTEEASSDKNNQLIQHGSSFTLAPTDTRTFFISRRFQCRGKAPKLKLTQAFALIFRRLRHRAYFMNEVDMSEQGEPVSCSSTQGVEFFEWTLHEGDSIVFDMAHFVGMSSEVTLSTLVSPRVSSLLLGRVLFAQATGPGTVLLMAKGRAEICEGEQSVGSLPPQRMIAMSIGSRLFVESETDLLNVYFSDAHIKPIAGRMLVDVDTQSSGSSGLSTFLKHFLWPG